MSYKYLIVSALQEELEPFKNLISPNLENLDLGVKLVKIIVQNNSAENVVELLLYSSNKMGMSYNAAKIMQVIIKFNPTYVFFIGICAGLKEHNFGSVLIPKRVFSYESGKYSGGIFSPDYLSYETSDQLRSEAVSFHTQNINIFPYKVIVDEDFCSGAAVIDEKEIVKKILENGSRKLSGLDMESYSIACINDILKPKNQLLIVKGISDKAIDKGNSEKSGERQKAKKNAAHFVFKFIEHLEVNGLGINVKPQLRIEISPNVSNEPGIKHKLKIRFYIYNETPFPIVIESLSFIFDDPVMKINGSGINKSKPSFYVGRKREQTEIYKDSIVLNPNESITNSWIAINPSLGEERLQDAFTSRKVGKWNYKCWYLSENPYSEIYSIKV
ncbi:hypothetical protein GCM10028808_70800 [Spirosoma migulaei]